MKAKLLLTFITYLLSIVIYGQSVAKLDNNRQDFGTIDKHTVEYVETTFKIANIGETPLLIYKVDHSCGCVSLDFSKHPIKKGESGYVKLKVNVKQLNGKFNKVAFVKTNATKDNGVLLLRVTGAVR